MEKILTAYANGISSKDSPRFIVTPLDMHEAKFCVIDKSFLSFPAKYTVVIEMADDSYDVEAKLTSVVNAHDDHFNALDDHFTAQYVFTVVK